MGKCQIPASVNKARAMLTDLKSTEHEKALAFQHLLVFLYTTSPNGYKLTYLTPAALYDQFLDNGNRDIQYMKNRQNALSMFNTIIESCLQEGSFDVDQWEKSYTPQIQEKLDSISFDAFSRYNENKLQKTYSFYKPLRVILKNNTSTMLLSTANTLSKESIMKFSNDNEEKRNNLVIWAERVKYIFKSLGASPEILDAVDPQEVADNIILKTKNQEMAQELCNEIDELETDAIEAEGRCNNRIANKLVMKFAKIANIIQNTKFVKAIANAGNKVKNKLSKPEKVKNAVENALAADAVNLKELQGLQVYLSDKDIPIDKLGAIKNPDKELPTQVLLHKLNSNPNNLPKQR